MLVASGGTTGQSKLSRRSFVAWERLIDVGPLRDRRQLVCTSFAYVAQVLVDQVLMARIVALLEEAREPQEDPSTSYVVGYAGQGPLAMGSCATWS